MKWLQHIFKGSKKSGQELNQKEPFVISTEPDEPLAGCKICWLAVKGESPEEIIRGIGMNKECEVNWVSANAYVRKNDKVFVTPSIKGYVFLINMPDPEEIQESLAKWAMQFEEIQYFASHRVEELSCWIKYVNGERKRRYYYCGAQGNVMWDDGLLTEEEKELGLINLPDTSYGGEETDWDSLTFPNEELVIDLAEKWGANPFFECYQLDNSTGMICTKERFTV